MVLFLFVSDLARFLRDVTGLLMNFPLMFKSWRVYSRLRNSKKSDTVVIFSGYLGHSSSSLPVGADVFVNSSGFRYLSDFELSHDVLVHYQADYHPPLDKAEYISRCDYIKSTFKPAFLFSSFSVGETVGSLTACNRFLPIWPFLKPYNGPAFLLWLALKMNYAKIFLVGCEGTQMKGAVLAKSATHNGTYNTSIIDLCLGTARMIREFNLLFDYAKSCNTDVRQVSDTSWIQPENFRRVVVEIDDSWSKRSEGFHEIL